MESLGAVGETLLLFWLIERCVYFGLLAHYDALTSRPNRRGLFTWAPFVTKRANWSAIMIDTDKFKAINDSYGHAAGDAVLKWLGKACHAIVRGPAANGIASRIGGDELALLVPVDARGAAYAAHCLRRLVALHVFGGGRRVTISVGVATAGPGDTLDSVLERADRAAYRAKRAGGNRVEIDDGASFTSSSSYRRRSRTETQRPSSLRRAIMDTPRAIWRVTGVRALASPARLFLSNVGRRRATRVTARRLVRVWKRLRSNDSTASPN